MLSEYPLVVRQPAKAPPIDTLAVPGSDTGIDDVAIDDVTDEGVR